MESATEGLSRTEGLLLTPVAQDFWGPQAYLPKSDEGKALDNF
jgi:hypothetical protein